MNRQTGVRDFKYAGKICPLCIGHVIQRMRSGYNRIVNGILQEMSEVITQERIAGRTFKLGGGVDHVTHHVRPLTKVKTSKVKVTRSRICSSNTITRQRMVVSTSNLVETFIARCALHDTF